MEIVVHSKKPLIQQKFQKKLYYFNRNIQLGVQCEKWSNWPSGVGQKILLRLPVLLGIRLHPKTSASLRLRIRNPDCGCDLRAWRFVDVNDPATSTHKHSVSDCSGDWSTLVLSNYSWTNVTRPCFLIRADPASEKLGIISLSAVVLWVSCRTMTNTLFLWTNCSITLVVFAVSPSVFSWSMLVFGHLLQ